jgi:hypothetical protein
MIIIKIKGGLGNQLFEYAFARSLVKKHGSEIIFDLSYYRQQNFRKFNLDKFNINDFKVLSFKDSFYLKLQKRFPKIFKKFNILNESCGQTDYSNCLNVKLPCYLNGYWQQSILFEDIKSILRKEFTLKEKLFVKNQKFLNQIQNTNSVAVHVRRDDYVSIPQNDPYNVCDLNYYNNALGVINKKVCNPVFFIFSDDIEWCKKNIKTETQTFFVQGNEDKPYIDLYLYSKCKHAITANSTFSWWATWLNKNKDKVVITPYYYRKNVIAENFITDFQIRI